MLGYAGPTQPTLWIPAFAGMTRLRCVLSNESFDSTLIRLQAEDTLEHKMLGSGHEPQPNLLMTTEITGVLPVLSGFDRSGDPGGTP